GGASGTQARRGCLARAAGDPGGRRGRRTGTARDARRAAQRGGRRRQRPQPTGQPGRTRAGGRPPRDSDRDRRAAPASARGGPGCLPDRAGSAHQREPSRRPCLRVGAPALHARGPLDPGRRRRQGHRHRHRHPAVRSWAGPGRHAGTGVRARRPAPGRTTRRRRLPGARRTPRAGTVVIRVLLADDQALIRSGIRSLLEAEDDIEVGAEPAGGQPAAARAPATPPTSALLDIQMPVLDGLEATRQIAADERLDSVRVVVLTNFGRDEYIFAALRAGASGFLLKDTQPAELLQALRVAMRGDALLSPAVTRRLIGEFVARPPDAVAAAGMEALTNREREVVALVAHGLSNDEIADAMVLSPATAKTHVSRAMIKLGARDRAQLVVFAYQAGLVTPRTAGQIPGHYR